jgi:hypothetical protein
MNSTSPHPDKPGDAGEGMHISWGVVSCIRAHQRDRVAKLGGHRAGADEGTLSVAEGASLMRVLDRAPAVRHQRDRAVLGASGVQHGPFGRG